MNCYNIRTKRSEILDCACIQERVCVLVRGSLRVFAWTCMGALRNGEWGMTGHGTHLKPALTWTLEQQSDGVEVSMGGSTPVVGREYCASYVMVVQHTQSGGTILCLCVMRLRMSFITHAGSHHSLW